ncbi:MAG: hypothetical protein FJZ47_00355 [Candidatus Tectomicrobia bacterium]|uniref:Uncharacterized protein n=1 Tax=Tectimicrobiota bacterium TaxID=2528274 RepID=A0A937VWE5_UNCTE|nr:hypothetical protein [Candidatus Tectomicrobia bacterium]
MDGEPMGLIITLATLFLGLTIVLCGGTIVRYLLASPFGASRVDEIRRLRQEGLAVNQDGEL